MRAPVERGRWSVAAVWGGWVVVVAAVAAAAAVVLSQGCGGESTQMLPPNVCGEAGAPLGMDCAAVTECGAGAANHVQVSFCENCFSRSDTHFCESGTCRGFDLELTNVNFSFTVPAAAIAAKSFTIASLNPTMADGGRLTCAALLSGDCPFVNNPAINARNSRFNNIQGGDFFMGQISIDPGEDRLLFLQLTSGQQGIGTVLAKGCAEGIDVTKGQAPGTPVALELQ